MHGPDFTILLLWRAALAAAGLAAFLALESRRPWRRFALPRLRHYLVNLELGAANVVLMRLVLGSLAFALAWYAAAQRVGLFNAIGLWWPANVGLTVVLFDLVTYAIHRLFHRLAWLWRLHRVHHSDSQLDVTTAVRFHPLEVIFSALVQAGLIVVLGAAPLSVAGFEAALLMANQFQHSALRIVLGADLALRRIIVTPGMHRIHHSVQPAQYQSNFATIFSCWDRLLGTYRAETADEQIAFGLPGLVDGGQLTLGGLLLMPLGRRFSTAGGEQATRPLASRRSQEPARS